MRVGCACNPDVCQDPSLQAQPRLAAVGLVHRRDGPGVDLGRRAVGRMAEARAMPILRRSEDELVEAGRLVPALDVGTHEDRLLARPVRRHAAGEPDLGGATAHDDDRNHLGFWGRHRDLP